MVIEMFHNGQPKDEALFPLEIFGIKFSTATIQCCQGAIVRFDSTTLPFAGQKLYQDCRMQTEILAKFVELIKSLCFMPCVIAKLPE
ncbi:hypothetical protein V6Z11_D07G031300 [Gossypium hirsutum]